jgi:hypothetical protein
VLSGPFTIKHTLGAVWKIDMGKNTSHRHIEFVLIAPCSFHFQILPDYQEIYFSYDHVKQKGEGTYKKKVASMDTIKTCSVVWTLILLQQLGAIKSAIDVWDGNKELKVNSSHNFQSEQSFCLKIQRAKKKLNK